MQGCSAAATIATVSTDAGLLPELPADQQVLINPVAGRLTLLAGAFAAGIAAARVADSPIVWPWLVAATVALLGAVTAQRRTGVALALLAATCAALGGGWQTIRFHRVAADDIATLATAAPRIVHVTGVATRDPEMRRRSAGSMAAFDYRRPAVYFPMTVDGVVGRDGSVIPACGAVYVRVDETLPPFRAGDRVTVQGVLRAPGEPENPGAFDFARYARNLGQAGVLSAPQRELVQVERAERSAAGSMFLRWRATVRQRADALLLADMPAATADQSALLTALLLGRRDPQLDDLSDSFRRVGLAYLLAISGLHLGVLAAGIVLAARFVGLPERWHGVLLIAAALAYVFLVEVRLPVLRAAVMVVAAGAAFTIGRRVRLTGAIALAAVGLLLWRPDQLLTAGFQLSFGVVLALALLAPIVRVRWFGLAENNPRTVGAMISEWAKTSLAVAVVAWLVASPIIAYHFGMFCPLAAPLSIVAIPLVAALLLLGYAKMLLAALLPSAALLVAVPLSLGAQILLALVAVMDAAPGSTLIVPYPSIAWTFAALAWSIAWTFTGLYDRGRGVVRWSMIAALLVLIVWLQWPRLPLHTQPDLRVDMLSVGDGSCYIVRSAGETLVFDAGSARDLDAGERTIVPALRRMNIFHVDTLAISHPNLDHYSAVVEVADAFGVREVLVTQAFRDAVAADLDSSAAQLMQLLNERRVTIRTVGAGDSRRVGRATMTVLHPSAETDYERVNDTSMVLRFTLGRRSVLFTGDVQQEAIDDLLAERPGLAADVMELPHHGSFNDSAIALVEQVQPTVVLQSAGWSRYRGDRWRAVLDGMARDVTRLVTARDGACHVEIDGDGTITTGRFKTPVEARSAD